MIVDIIIAIIFAEAVTELCVKSEFFNPLRAWLFNNKNNKFINFTHQVFDCGYCFSVWAGVFSLCLISLDNIYINFFTMGIVVHRLSNFFHFVVDRVRG